MHIVIYRWRSKPEQDESFRRGWRLVTQAIYRTRGSLGSRLHRADDGTWVAVAQWPDLRAWQLAHDAGPTDSDGGEMMRSSAEFVSEEHLEVVDDLCRDQPWAPEPAD
jgi:hypothetical protein